MDCLRFSSVCWRPARMPTLSRSSRWRNVRLVGAARQAEERSIPSDSTARSRTAGNYAYIIADTVFMWPTQSLTRDITYCFAGIAYLRKNTDQQPAAPPVSWHVRCYCVTAARRREFACCASKFEVRIDSAIWRKLVFGTNKGQWIDV